MKQLSCSDKSDISHRSRDCSVSSVPWLVGLLHLGNNCLHQKAGHGLSWQFSVMGRGHASVVRYRQTRQVTKLHLHLSASLCGTDAHIDCRVLHVRRSQPRVVEIIADLSPWQEDMDCWKRKASSGGHMYYVPHAAEGPKRGLMTI
jgi:hypothetical protein